jgi:hypothetical protein
MANISYQTSFRGLFNEAFYISLIVLIYNSLIDFISKTGQFGETLVLNINIILVYGCIPTWFYLSIIDLLGEYGNRDTKESVKLKLSQDGSIKKALKQIVNNAALHSSFGAFMGIFSTLLINPVQIATIPLSGENSTSTWFIGILLSLAVAAFSIILALFFTLSSHFSSLIERFSFAINSGVTTAVFIAYTNFVISPFAKSFIPEVVTSNVVNFNYHEFVLTKDFLQTLGRTVQIGYIIGGYISIAGGIFLILSNLLGKVHLYLDTNIGDVFLNLASKITSYNFNIKSIHIGNAIKLLIPMIVFIIYTFELYRVSLANGGGAILVLSLPAIVLFLILK